MKSMDGAKTRFVLKLAQNNVLVAVSCGKSVNTFVCHGGFWRIEMFWNVGMEKMSVFVCVGGGGCGERGNLRSCLAFNLN